MSTIPLPFRGSAPDRDEWVLAQRVNFDPERWRRLLPNESLWPSELNACPRGKRWPYVDRRTVLHLGRSARASNGAAHTYVAAAVWGAGTGAQSVQRRARVLAGGTEATCKTLASAVRQMLDTGPVAAYAALHGNGNAVKHLGPSFGTKLLYFAGFDRAPDDRQPLILDQYVAVALNRLCGLDWPADQWSTEQYSDYLDIAHEWANQWQTRPDVVERALFAVGKSSRLTVGVLTGLPLHER